MTRFITWVLRGKPPTSRVVLEALLPGLILDLQVALVRLAKWVPSVVGGPFLWGYVYGPMYERYRGTLIAVWTWYLTLQWSPPGWTLPWSTRQLPRPGDLNLLGGRTRLTPRVRPYPAGSVELADSEWWTLDSVVPIPGFEPFQGGQEEFFLPQQVGSDQSDEEPTLQEEYLFGSVGATTVEEDREDLLYRERYRSLEGRHKSVRSDYHPNFETSESFRVGQPSRSIGRVVTSGDGPRVQDHDDPEEFSLAQVVLPVDWYHARSRVERITRDDYVGSYWRYLLHEHRFTWMGDPQGRPARWAQKVNGVTPWLYRTVSTGWSPGWNRERLFQKRGVRRWIFDKSTRKLTSSGFPRRRVRTREVRWTERYRSSLVQLQRWTRPDPSGYLDVETDEFGRLRNDRFDRWSLPRRGKLLAWRESRAVREGSRVEPVGFDLTTSPGVLFSRRPVRPVYLAEGREGTLPLPGGSGASRWRRLGWTKKFDLEGRPRRGRYLPWSLNPYDFLDEGRPRSTPATGAALLWGIAFLVGVLLVGLVGGDFLFNGVVRGFGWGTPGVPFGRIDLIPWVTRAGPLEEDYLRAVSSGLPEWWSAARNKTPREVRTTHVWGLGFTWIDSEEYWSWSTLR